MSKSALCPSQTSLVPTYRPRWRECFVGAELRQFFQNNTLFYQHFITQPNNFDQHGLPSANVPQDLELRIKEFKRKNQDLEIKKIKEKRKKKKEKELELRKKKE